MSGESTSRQQWNARYSEADVPLFGREPSEYVRQVAARSDFQAATVLMLADGDGRNGRWLAARGCRVTAVDLSEVATGIAGRLDAEAGVAVERLAADLATWPGLERRFDAVFLVALHGPAAVRRRAVEIGASHVAPGGWFVLEGFAKEQAERDTMGPSEPEKLYGITETLDWLAGFEIIEAMQGLVLLAEGKRHQGHAEMVHLLVRRK